MDYKLKQDYGFDPKTATPVQRQFVYELLRTEQNHREMKAGEKLLSHYLTNLRASIYPRDFGAIRNASRYDSELRKRLK